MFMPCWEVSRFCVYIFRGRDFYRFSGPAKTTSSRFASQKERRMGKGKWDKSPASHIEAFSAALPSHPAVECRKMFGYPCAFVNGNMFCGLHEANICVRLGAAEAAARISAGRAAVFAPLAGRVMREYVAIPKGDCADPARLSPWLKDGLQFALALPAKVSRKN